MLSKIARILNIGLVVFYLAAGVAMFLLNVATIVKLDEFIDRSTLSTPVNHTVKGITLQHPVGRNMIPQRNTIKFPTKGPESTTKGYLDKPSAGFVRVEMTNVGFGTGVAISPDLVLTNNHVCDMAANKRAPGTFFRLALKSPEHTSYLYAKVHRKSSLADLCLLKVVSQGKKLTPVKIAKEPVKFGDQIFVVGNPLGIFGSVAEGRVGSYAEVLGSEARLISAPIYPGNSGSGVFNDKGELSGLVFAGLFGNYQSPTSIGWMIVHKEIVKFLEENK